jgi:hypothetical protein
MLKPLSVEDSQTLVEHLPAMTDLPAQLRQSILERAEGNPFFTEEPVRSLMDGGVIVRCRRLARRSRSRPGADRDPGQPAGAPHGAH